MNLSVIIPTYNEKGNIVSLVTDIKKTLIEENISFEVIVVDDDSNDGTSDFFQKAFGEDKDVRMYVRKSERGLASAIYFGIKKATGEYVVVMDADYSHDPILIPQMVRNLENYDMVIGSRYIGRGGMENQKRYWLSWFYNLYLRFLFNIPLTDFLSGYFCIRRNYLFSFVEKHKGIFYGYGDYFMRLIFIVNKKKGRFAELPSFYTMRFYGESKTNIVGTFLLYTRASLGLFFRGVK